MKSEEITSAVFELEQISDEIGATESAIESQKKRIEDWKSIGGDIVEQSKNLVNLEDTDVCLREKLKKKLTEFISELQ